MSHQTMGRLRPGLWGGGWTVTSLIMDTSNLVKTLNILGEYSSTR